jgi:hypothetical protein
MRLCGRIGCDRRADTEKCRRRFIRSELRPIREARDFSAPDLWINLQKGYELECARREIGASLSHIHPRAACPSEPARTKKPA